MKVQNYEFLVIVQHALQTFFRTQPQFLQRLILHLTHSFACHIHHITNLLEGIRMAIVVESVIKNNDLTFSFVKY